VVAEVLGLIGLSEQNQLSNYPANVLEHYSPNTLLILTNLPGSEAWFQRKNY